ncbi:MAG: prepilin-type N-terminal cleavage/methylation domain-containing protein [Verrucomicrobiota bacterium]
MPNTFNSSTAGRVRRPLHGFSLVEVTLAVAIVTIGIVGILALFPLGMDAVRKAEDDTQMMAIGQDWIAYYQQMIANSNYYAGMLAGSLDATTVIDTSENYSSTQQLDGINYIADCLVITNGFATIAAGGTNMITRVQIAVYRTTGPPSYTPLTNSGYNTTHYYFTEVTRYVQ